MSHRIRRPHKSIVLFPEGQVEVAVMERFYVVGIRREWLVFHMPVYQREDLSCPPLLPTPIWRTQDLRATPSLVDQQNQEVVGFRRTLVPWA